MLSQKDLLKHLASFTWMRAVKIQERSARRKVRKRPMWILCRRHRSSLKRQHFVNIIYLYFNLYLYLYLYLNLYLYLIWIRVFKLLCGACITALCLRNNILYFAKNRWFFKMCYFIESQDVPSFQIFYFPQRRLHWKNKQAEWCLIKKRGEN